MTREELVRLLESATYKFAKTMPRIPHSYILENNWPDKAQFNAMMSAVNQYGRRERFFKRFFTYFYHGEYKYWAMKISDGTGVINRAKA